MNIEDIIPAINSGEIDMALDAIIDNADDLDHEDVAAIMSAARTIDPTLSNDGAEIRDTLRDNVSFDII